MASILVTPAAENDLVNIWLYIARDNQDVDDRVYQAAEKTFESLVAAPRMGILYRQKKAEGHPIYSHAHFYTVAETIHLAEKENFILRKSCSTLFRNPEKPPSDPPEIVPGIRAEAGFVGLLFTSPLPPSSF